MIKINKGEPLPEFLDWKKREGKTNNWKKLPDQIRINIRDYILRYEQNGLCGYTEKPITSDNTKSHIDHFRKIDWFPKLTFEWDNYIVASKDEWFGAKWKDNHSDLTAEDYDIIYNPVESGMENVVGYQSDGTIYPKNDRANRTIKVFNLNHQSLKDKRKEVIDKVESYFKCNYYTNDEIRLELKDMGFPSVVNYELDFLQKNTTP